MPRNKSWFQVNASAPGEAEIAVRGLIGEWGVNDVDFINALESLGEIDALTVRINSRGGDVDHALSIFNALKSHPANITVRIDAVAMSAASIIAMAGDQIIMPANTMMMIHNPWTIAAGNAQDLRQAADTLDKYTTLLISTYTARTGKSEAEIQAMLDEETFMTAAEAVEQGFADTVEAIAKNPAAQARAYAAALGIPDDVLARMAAAGEVEKSSSLAAHIQARATLLGIEAHAADIALDENLTTVESAYAALADAREIVDLCALASMPEQAAPLIRRRATLAEARKTLTDARADADESIRTDGHPPSESHKPAQSSADVWAKVIPNRQTKEQ
ncbi:MAG: Clp protease ClpP [Sulfuricella sp.]|nr:Clp protease ClpP [Sulfuricella sp.]